MFSDGFYLPAEIIEVEEQNLPRWHANKDIFIVISS